MIKMTDLLKRLYLATMRQLPLPAQRYLHYTRAHGRPPRTRHPRTFTEKVNWRIVHDRRPIIAQMGDKLRMKEYATRVAGDLVGVPLTRWVGQDVAELAMADLPEHWVLKPNHSSNRVYFGHGRPDVAEVEAATAGWLEETLSVHRAEWVYTQAAKTLFAEDLLGKPGQDLVDYKFFVFSGGVELIQVDSSRFSGHQRRYYGPDWTVLDTQVIYPLAPVQAAPQSLPCMLEAAGRLGAEFDFIRVDLYDVDGKVFLGELSPYPDSGLGPFRPRDLDVRLGSRWALPHLSAAPKSGK